MQTHEIACANSTTVTELEASAHNIYQKRNKC